MVCFIFPGKNLIVLLFVSLLLLFCCHVSCVLVTVTRKHADIFSYPGILKDCSDFCQGRSSFVFKDLTKQGICICQCGSGFRTFVTAELKCFKDKEIRNTTGGFLDFQLYKNEQPNGYLEIISFDSKNVTILFKVRMRDDKKCKLNDIEQLSRENFQEWNSVKDLLDDVHCFELDDDDIERTYTWLPLSYEGWMKLTLKWKVDPTMFVGRIMRLNVTCKRRRNKLTGLMVFKVNGTFEASKTSTMSCITSSPLQLISSSAHIPVILLTSQPLIISSTNSLLMSTSDVKTTTGILTPQPMISPTNSLLMSSSEVKITGILTPQPMISSTSSLLMSSSPVETTRIISSSVSVETQEPTSFHHSTETSKFGSTNRAGKEESISGGNSTVIVSLAVVGCLLLLGVVILAVLYLRSRSAKSSHDKNAELSVVNGNFENPIAMSQVESSHPEAENTIDSSERGEVNHEYDYPDINLKNYASLDMTKVESRPTYQSLINVKKNVYENMPSESCETPTAGDINREYENAAGDVENYDSLDMTKTESKRVYQSLINVERDLYENIPSEEKTGKDNPESVSNMP